MKKIGPFCVLFLACIVSCGRSDPDSVATTPHQEIVHSISEYGIEYKDRARVVSEEMMSHWPAESYLRWRPVRIEPSEVLRDDILSASAMPQFLSLTPFPDVTLVAQRASYLPIESTGGAIWEGVIPTSETSNVRVNIVSATGHIAFAVEIWDPPKKYYIFATDSPDVYVAIEGQINPLATLD